MGFVSTIAGTMRYGDNRALGEFYAQHHEAHVNLNAVIARQYGVSLDCPDLRGPISHSWISDHYFLHKAIDRVLGTNSTPGLSMTWDNEQMFNEWHAQNLSEHVQFGLKTGVS